MLCIMADVRLKQVKKKMEMRKIVDQHNIVTVAVFHVDDSDILSDNKSDATIMNAK